MSLLRPASIFLRNFLIKQHPYFSCCASCGEITTPLQESLCASLSPDFPVDVVVLGHEDCDSAKIDITAQYIAQYSPWVRKIFWAAKKSSGPSSEKSIAGVRVVHTAELRHEAASGHDAASDTSPDMRPGASVLPDEALLHNLPQLSEHFFVVKKNFYLNRPLRALDLFTPNGIPLLFLTAPDAASQTPRPAEQAAFTRLKERAAAMEPWICPAPGIYAQSKENSMRFLPVFSKLNANKYSIGSNPSGSTVNPPNPDYHTALAHWTYVNRRAVPKTLAHPLARYAAD